MTDPLAFPMPAPLAFKQNQCQTPCRSRCKTPWHSKSPFVEQFQAPSHSQCQTPQHTYETHVCHTPWHTYRTYARPPGIPMESMPDPPAYPMPNRLAFKDPKGKAMPDPPVYLWNLCHTPCHTYGTCAAPLGITMEPMPHPLAFSPNARNQALKQKQCQTLRHSNKTYADNLAYHQILTRK